MKVVDHRSFVRDPATETEWDWIWKHRRKPKRQCWAVAHRTSPDRERACMFKAREPGLLTCGVHCHLEERARMLKNAIARMAPIPEENNGEEISQGLQSP
jgi:hypothetical protein